MEEIARYTEAHPQVKRLFLLYPGQVRVQADWRTKGRHENTVDLANLNPDFSVFHVRNKLFKPAMLVSLVGIGIALFAGDIDSLRQLRPIPITGIVVMLLGALLAWRTAKPVRFVRFNNREGKPALDIACTTKSKSDFDDFVRAIQKQIKRAR